MYRILEGLRVVEGSAFVAAPSGGMTLAQLGADVIRFDQAGGGIDARRWPLARGAGGRSLYWTALNKGKRSLAVDFRKPEARELVAALVTAPGPGAGLFLTNLPQRGPLAYEALREHREDLIMLSIAGNRDGGTAVDYTVNAAVGVPFSTGDARPDRPVNNMLPAWDLMTGLCAALGLLAAERHRARGGGGQHVRLALADVALWTVGNLGHIAEAMVNGADRPAHGNAVYGAFGRDFATADGRRVMVVAISPRQWRSLVEATGSARQMALAGEILGADLADEGERYRARELIAAVLEPWFRARTLAEVRAALDAAGACWGPYQSFTQMVREDPRCSTDNPMFELLDQPGVGRTLVPGSPLDFAALARVPLAPAPRIGEHTDEVLAEVLGLSAAAIGDLHERGVIAGPEDSP